MPRLPPALCCAAALVAWTPARAQPASPPPDAAPQQPEASPHAGGPLDPEEMAEIRGGDGVRVEVLSRQQLSATSSGNVVNAGSLTSGPVTFATDALDGFTGIGNFVINTGANNTLQGAINISIGAAPGP